MIRTIQLATMGARRLEPDEQIIRLWPLRIAIDAMRASKHTMDDWQALLTAINMVEGFGKKTNLVRHYAQWRDDAQATVCAAFLRQKHYCSNCFTPREMEVLENIRFVLAQVLDVCTQSELFSVDQYMLARMQQIRAGKSNGATVL